MKKQRIKTNFGKRPDGKLIVLTHTIIDSMTGNTNFLTPQPTLANLATALDEFETAVSAASTGGAMQKTIRDQKKEVLAELMEKEAIYVTLVSDGDVAKLQSSGFELTKIPGPIGPVEAKNFGMKAAGKGELKFFVDTADGIKSYQFEYKKVDAQEWIVKSSTKSKMLVQGLQRGAEYVGRVLPIGASENREYSDEITAFVA